MVASPTGYDPIVNGPTPPATRRDTVLQKMLEQRCLTQAQYDDAVLRPLPDRGDLQPPEEDTEHPYFTSWVRSRSSTAWAAARRARGWRSRAA